ncbi:diiron oxygenase [Mucilaginibacter sp. HMF5004]|uniref:diiron oxygenase n=1 Tax=Mucilaginibacter rivuli TaxID=2857527 RepID=UPI001C602886|nr:diiron oxygenase [Mucilaginibacter rivuli]MBW4891640.1 diiron oxygenase [Mucilaginibacter rivuli]
MNDQEIERLIKISKERPLLPETYVPWHEDIKPAEVYLPAQLTSLHGLPLYNLLSAEQKLDLGRHEMVQVLYSYAWGEGLFCLFMSKYILTLQPESVEYRFLIRELIEEYRHQEMFAQAIQKLNGQPIKPTRIHKFIGLFTAKYLPVDFLFMGSLAVELVTDTYGDQSRRHPDSYLVLKKVFDLHSIEEGRHIYFTKNMLKRYTDKAGYIRRTVYSFVILFNIYFVRTLYVRREIYQRIGLENTNAVYKQAFKNYKYKFTDIGLAGVIEFVDSWGGFNRLTKWAWRGLMGVSV